MQLTLEAPSLRGYAEVRRIIDEALGDGIGMSAATAYGKLPAVARAAWFVEMLGAHADGSMHLHSQQFSTGELDGPMLLARLAEATCAHLGASQDLQRRRRGTRAATPQRESGLAGPAQPAAADPSPPGRRVTSREQSRVISGER